MSATKGGVPAAAGSIRPSNSVWHQLDLRDISTDYGAGDGRSFMPACGPVTPGQYGPPLEGAVGAILTYWYYYVPDYVLAVLMYTVLGRVALSLFLDPDSQNYIWRFFCTVTDPVIGAVGQVTPKAAPPIILWLFSFVWLFWVRFALRIAYAVAGLLPVK